MNQTTLDTIAVMELIKNDVDFRAILIDINADTVTSWDEKVAEFTLFANKAGADVDGNLVDWWVVLGSMGVKRKIKPADAIKEARRHLIQALSDYRDKLLENKEPTWMYTFGGLMAVELNIPTERLVKQIKADWAKLTIELEEPEEDERD